MNTYEQEFFLPYQQAWIDDRSPLKIMEKSRQIGITYADAFDSVLKASSKTKSADVWVSSRDEPTARLYLQHCKRWAQALNIGAQYLGQQIVSNEKKDLTAEVLRFNTGFCIYSLTSSPDAIASRTGHIKLDEFALHKDQRELFRVAKGCSLMERSSSLKTVPEPRWVEMMLSWKPHRVQGAADAVAHYLYYDTAIAENANLNLIELNIRLTETDELRVYATTATLSFAAFGTETL
jgi:hypothetical protein